MSIEIVMNEDAMEVMMDEILKKREETTGRLSNPERSRMKKIFLLMIEEMVRALNGQPSEVGNGSKRVGGVWRSKTEGRDDGNMVLEVKVISEQ